MRGRKKVNVEYVVVMFVFIDWYFFLRFYGLFLIAF
jgi:hypothetical protein